MSLGLSMDVNLKLVDVGFCLLFVVWILWGALKRRENGDEREGERETSTLSPSPKIIISLNAVITFSYLGFFLGEVWVFGIVSIDAVISAIAWFLSCMVAVYSVKREQRNWPLLLIVWWGVSTSCGLIQVVFFFIDFQKYLPKCNMIDFGVLPFSLVLFTNSLRSINSKQMSDFEKPLLDNNLGGESGPFSSAGIWSLLTFRWLNPLFAKGHHDKLEFEDIPPIPHTETADEAVLLLEEFLREQKTQASSLPKAIFDAIQTPLAKNAVFAGNF